MHSLANIVLVCEYKTYTLCNRDYNSLHPLIEDLSHSFVESRIASQGKRFTKNICNYFAHSNAPSNVRISLSFTNLNGVPAAALWQHKRSSVPLPSGLNGPGQVARIYHSLGRRSYGRRTCKLVSYPTGRVSYCCKHLMYGLLCPLWKWDSTHFSFLKTGMGPRTFQQIFGATKQRDSNTTRTRVLQIGVMKEEKYKD